MYDCHCFMLIISTQLQLYGWSTISKIIFLQNNFLVDEVELCVCRDEWKCSLTIFQQEYIPLRISVSLFLGKHKSLLVLKISGLKFCFSERLNFLLISFRVVSVRISLLFFFSLQAFWFVVKTFFHIEFCWKSVTLYIFHQELELFYKQTLITSLHTFFLLLNNIVGVAGYRSIHC